jgi:hypothetical protein
MDLLSVEPHPECRSDADTARARDSTLKQARRTKSTNDAAASVAPQADFQFEIPAGIFGSVRPRPASGSRHGQTASLPSLGGSGASKSQESGKFPLHAVSEPNLGYNLPNLLDVQNRLPLRPRDSFQDEHDGKLPMAPFRSYPFIYISSNRPSLSFFSHFLTMMYQLMRRWIRSLQPWKQSQYVELILVPLTKYLCSRVDQISSLFFEQLSSYMGPPRPSFQAFSAFSSLELLTDSPPPSPPHDASKLRVQSSVAEVTSASQSQDRGLISHSNGGSIKAPRAQTLAPRNTLKSQHILIHVTCPATAATVGLKKMAFDPNVSLSAVISKVSFLSGGANRCVCVVVSLFFFFPRVGNSAAANSRSWMTGCMA